MPVFLNDSFYAVSIDIVIGLQFFAYNFHKAGRDIWSWLIMPTGQQTNLRARSKIIGNHVECLSCLQS